METLHMLGFLCVGIAGAYFLSVSQTLGKFVFALQAIVSNIAVYLGIEVFLILLFAGTLFVTTGTDGAGDLSFWRLCLVGLLLVIGIDDLSIANTSLEELTDGSAAVTVVLLLFQSLQFIVLVSVPFIACFGSESPTSSASPVG